MPKMVMIVRIDHNTLNTKPPLKICHYNNCHLPEERSRANSQNTLYVKYTSDSVQVFLFLFWVEVK
jgi:hypothetical protein